MIDATQFGLGYRADLEDMANLIRTQNPFVLPEQPETFSAPASISHRGWKKIKNQGQVGRCSGASRASAEEILNWIATGEAITLSMDYCYAENQKYCGLYGQGDTGATIDGSMQAASATGVVLESVMPQSPKYNPNVPAGAEDTGKLHVIKSHAVMTSYDDCLKWLQTGQGVILIGITWTNALTQAGPRITADMGKGKGGGHALVIEGYNEKGDLDMENSWGTTWGDGGWSMLAPEFVDWEIKNGATFIGISDLESYGFRVVQTFEGMTG